ncbi:polysaccharide lyase, partial [bacterium]|nr:polysaccharide lyase [bacterium]
GTSMHELQGTVRARCVRSARVALLSLLLAHVGGCRPGDLVRPSDDPVTRLLPGEVAAFRFENGFENLTSVSDLASAGWTRFETTMPGNDVQLSHLSAHAGQTALRLAAVPASPDGPVSKSYVQVANHAARPLRFFAGNRVRLAAWFLVVGDLNLQGLVLFDLESGTCWRDEFGSNPSPGIRLMLSGGDDYLAVERGKIGLGDATLRQTAARFPRDRWVHVEWVVDLSSGADGRVSIVLDGQPILAADGATLPDATVMGAVLGRPDFRLNEPVYYDRIQVGITANASAYPVTVYVDDVRVESW